MTDVHAYPLGSGDHRPTRFCPCGPKAMGNLLEPSRPVWLHRAPPTDNSARTIPAEYLDAKPTRRTT